MITKICDACTGVLDQQHIVVSGLEIPVKEGDSVGQVITRRFCCISCLREFANRLYWQMPLKKRDLELSRFYVKRATIDIDPRAISGNHMMVDGIFMKEIPIDTDK